MSSGPDKYGDAVSRSIFCIRPVNLHNDFKMPWKKYFNELGK
jgi:hypothetical protein